MRPSSLTSLLVAAVALAVAPFAAHAATVIVTPTSTTWAAGDANSAITAAAPRSGDGSLQVKGNVSRFYGLGNPFSAASNLGLLSSVTAFAFDWRIDPASTSAYDADYTPALRLHIFDGAQRSELIWEGAYNGVYGNATKGDWYTADLTGNGSSFGTDPNKVWRFQSGIGQTDVNGGIGLFSVADWASGGLYSANAYIAAISVGAGSGVGTGYTAYADNVVLGFNGAEATTYNFETGVAPVPVPAALPLLAAALAGLGLVARRRKAA